MDSNSPSDPPVDAVIGAATPAPSEGQARFVSCRWQRAAEGDAPACCGHRDVLLTRELFFAGVACGPHPTYRVVCVMDYATSLRARRRPDLERTRPARPGAPGPLEHRIY